MNHAYTLTKLSLMKSYHRWIWWSPVLLLILTGIGVACWDNPHLLIVSLLNGLSLAALYFLVASGFSLIFGLMRHVNLAHGSLFLLGGYVGYSTQQYSESWYLALLTGFLAAAIAGVLMQTILLRHLIGDDLRQSLVTIGLSIILADGFIWLWGGDTRQLDAPAWLTATWVLPFIGKYSAFRCFLIAIALILGGLLWGWLHHTRSGLMIRAGVDDQLMLSASGVHVRRLFVITFAVGAGLAGLAGVIGGSMLSLAPGEDVRYLLASLVVVVVGGMGTITGAALGAILVGLTETLGLTYIPEYGVVLTFLMMVGVLAFRPTGILGKPA